MIGNVWEWTRSIPGLRREDAFVIEPDLNGVHDRIVRGSSWLSQEDESPHVTFRSFDPSCNAYEDLGFRIAIVTRKATR
jgi:formylglycine-generating enzyme required for sulfatase activity